jgi:3-oxoacyl-[acyl-carrier protein] reductase
MHLSLSGRMAVVTGANQGLGLVIAESFARAGADLAICARGEAKLAEAVEKIASARQSPRQRLLAERADVSLAEDVSRLSKRVFTAFPRIHILVNNAGVYGPMGRIEDVDWEEWKKALEINLNSSVLMCRAFLPHFREHRYGKIIQISGGGATSPLPRLESYAASKAAVVRFNESLALDCLEDHIDVNSVSPGLLETRMLEQVLEAGLEKVGTRFYERMSAVKQQGQATPLEVGANLCVFLASAASDGITGKLISAVWDDYEDWPNHHGALRNTDLYTLRRITGRDRNTGWGDK